MFKMLAGVMWSKGYRITDAEVRELRDAMNRHDGLFYLAAGAGFVADHKAQGDSPTRCKPREAEETYRILLPCDVGCRAESIHVGACGSQSRGTVGGKQ
jgi:hypothetical protein